MVALSFGVLRGCGLVLSECRHDGARDATGEHGIDTARAGMDADLDARQLFHASIVTTVPRSCHAAMFFFLRGLIDFVRVFGRRVVARISETTGSWSITIARTFVQP